MEKKLETIEQFVLTFSDEEISELNLRKGDKFTIETTEDGILLKKYGSIEIDIGELPREVLESLISQSVEKDVSVNDIINDIIISYIPEAEKNE